MAILLYVGLGGALGAMARYAMVTGISHWLGTGFPFGTLLVNILGCLLMGILVGLSAQYLALSQEMKAFLAVGVLGGFTTFSAFALDTAELFQRQLAPEALLYIAASVIFSLLLLILGMLLVRYVTGTL